MGGFIAWGCQRETIGLGKKPTEASKLTDAGSSISTVERDATPPPPPPPPPPTATSTATAPHPSSEPVRPPRLPWPKDAGHEVAPTEPPVVEKDAGHGCAVECDATAPFCRPDTGKCVQCLVDLSCPSTAPRCDLVTNHCVCTTNLDCRHSTNKCDSVTQQCLIGCTSSMTCVQFLVSPICDEVRGVCVDCLTSEDCKGHSLFGVPIELCRRGFCVQCEEETDCDSKHHCQAREGICVDCLTNEHCPTGTKCFNTHCVPT